MGCDELVPPPSKLSITRRIRTLGQISQRRGCDATTLVGTLVCLWCKAEFPAVLKPSLPFSKILAAEREVGAFVDILKRLSFLEATYWLSSSYAMLTEQRYQKELAMYFTPASLTEGLLDDLAEQGVEFGIQSFIDPACGGAAFLAPIALRMRAALKQRGLTSIELLKHIERHLSGMDLDETLCELSKIFLCMALHEDIQEAGYTPKFKVTNSNSLIKLVSVLGTVDVVVCNPPYRKVARNELEVLQGFYSDVIEAQPNLYCLFISLCVRLLRIGGRAALVTPTSFLSGQNFSRLRAFLIHNVDIEHIGIVSDRQGVFIDVEQETAMTVLRRRIEEDRTQTQANVSVVSGAGRYTSVGECLLPNGGSVWPVPRATSDVILLKAALKSCFRLSDYGYRVRIGAYVWNRDRRPKFESRQDARRAKAHTAMPLLWSRDITSGQLIRLETISSRDGMYRFVDLGDKRHTSVIVSPCVVMQRVTSNDQPRRLVAAAVSPQVFKCYGGFIAENHVVIIEANCKNPVLPPTKLSKLLSTCAVDRNFRCISGANNVSAFELNQLPLPDPQAIIKALEGGLSMDDAVNRAFDLMDRARSRSVG
jgi:adenine-specific DNA-methyltransferase